MRKLIRISIATIFLALLFMLLLISASIYTFNVLTDETLIAEIRFDQVGDRQYLARLRTGNFCTEQTLSVLGDQWRIDAQFLKWHYWALLFGLESQYRLERFEGRYRNIDEQNVLPTRSHEILPDTAVDIVSVAAALGPVNFLLDATYGSSTYQDIDTARVYSVYKSPTAIFTRSRPALPADSNADAIQVEVRRGCGGSENIWRRASELTNGALLDLN